MNKVKALFLLLLGVLLMDFAVENALPGNPLKLFGFELGRPPIFLLIYACLGLGFLGGWLAHALKVKKRKRAAAAGLAVEKPESPQYSQEQQGQ